MKRLYKICALALFVVVLFSLSGCIFNKGTVNELEGVYALEEYYYKSKTGSEYQLEDRFEYYILVIKGDDTVDVIFKHEGESERKSTHAYLKTFSEDDKKVVERITIKDFPQNDYAYVDNQLVLSDIQADIKLNFYTMREDLVSNEFTLNLQDGSERIKYMFTRVKDKVSDKNVEKAKEKSNGMLHG